MLQQIPVDQRVAVVRSLILSGAIRFERSPSGEAVNLNFRPKDAAMRGGPITADLARNIALVMSSAGEQLCQNCQAVVGLHNPIYPSKWADEGSPLVIAFARALRRGMTPLGFHQIKAKVSSKEEVGRVLVVDTFLGNDLDSMGEAIDALCGLELQVAGTMTFIGNGQGVLNGHPWSYMFTPSSLVEFCWQEKLVPQPRLGYVEHHLGIRH